jgi:hypothetical protein
MSNDIIGLKERGAGGVEFINYYNYGGNQVQYAIAILLYLESDNVHRVIQ